MLSRTRNTNRRCCLLIALLGALTPSGRTLAQLPTLASPELWREPVLGREFAAALWGAGPEPDPTPNSGAGRVRMFGMMPGFLADPVGLIDSEDPAAASDPVARALNAAGNDGPNWLQVVIGDDNPYFDMRKPGDPGGVGYFRLYSQMQVVDVGSTSLCVNLHATAPAGQQAGGVADGPTVLIPGVALFQELGGGAALQGFVGQPIRATTRGDDALNNAVRYGMGFQYPVLCPASRGDQGLYLFLQALGRYQYEGDARTGRAANWDLVPGVHFRLSDKCWMSLGASRNGLFTCSWRF